MKCGIRSLVLAPIFLRSTACRFCSGSDGTPKRAGTCRKQPITPQTEQLVRDVSHHQDGCFKDARTHVLAEECRRLKPARDYVTAYPALRLAMCWAMMCRPSGAAFPSAYSTISTSAHDEQQVLRLRARPTTKEAVGLLPASAPLRMTPIRIYQHRGLKPDFLSRERVHHAKAWCFHP